MAANPPDGLNFEAMWFDRSEEPPAKKTRQQGSAADLAGTSSLTEGRERNQPKHESAGGGIDFAKWAEELTQEQEENEKWAEELTKEHELNQKDSQIPAGGFRPGRVAAAAPSEAILKLRQWKKPKQPLPPGPLP